MTENPCLFFWLVVLALIVIDNMYGNTMDAIGRKKKGDENE